MPFLIFHKGTLWTNGPEMRQLLSKVPAVSVQYELTLIMNNSIIVLLQMRKLRLREAKRFVYHRVNAKILRNT